MEASDHSTRLSLDALRRELMQLAGEVSAAQKKAQNVSSQNQKSKSKIAGINSQLAGLCASETEIAALKARLSKACDPQKPLGVDLSSPLLWEHRGKILGRTQAVESQDFAENSMIFNAVEGGQTPLPSALRAMVYARKVKSSFPNLGNS